MSGTTWNNVTYPTNLIPEGFINVFYIDKINKDPENVFYCYEK